MNWRRGLVRLTAFPGRGRRVGLHIDIFGACSPFTRVAAAHSRGHQFVTRYPKASDISSPPCLLAILPALITLRAAGSMLVTISTVYRRLGLFDEKVVARLGKPDDDVLSILAPSVTFNPLLAEPGAAAEIARIKVEDPDFGAAEYDSVWRRDITSFIVARSDGRYARILRGLAGVQLLILDDWGLEPLDSGARHDLFKILKERYGRRSTILTSQIPVDKWHAVIGDPTYAGRHPRPSRPQRSPHRTRRRQPAAKTLRRHRPCGRIAQPTSHRVPLSR